MILYLKLSGDQEHMLRLKCLTQLLLLGIKYFLFSCHEDALKISISAAVLCENTIRPFGLGTSGPENGMAVGMVMLKKAIFSYLKGYTLKELTTEDLLKLIEHAIHEDEYLKSRKIEVEEVKN